MSNSVDQRVVQMDFDNAKFERGVRTTLESLTKLKKELDMTKSVKSMEKLTDGGFNFKGIEEGIDRLNRKFSTMGTIWTTVVQRATNAAISKFSGAVNQIKTGGMTRAANIEQANFMLEGLLSSKYKNAEKRAAKLQEISDAAMKSVDGTAYGYDEASKAAAQFYASGITNGDQMERVLLGVAGTAAMTGRDYGDIARIFTTVSGQGRLMGEQLNQLAASGINAAATLADHLGVTEKEVREMTSKGEIDFKTFAEAMSTAFGEHAKEANKTFNGALSNMKAAMNRIGAEFYTPYRKYMRDIFNAFTPVLNATKKILAPVIALYDKGFEQLSKKVVGFLGNFAKLDKKGNLVGTLATIGYRFEVMTKTFDKFKGFDTLWSGVADIFKTILTLVTPIGKAFKDVFSYGDKFYELFHGGMNTKYLGFENYSKATKMITEFSKEYKKLDALRGVQLGTTLLNLVKRFKEFTSSIKISEGTIANLYYTFGGLAAILDILIQVIGGIFKAIAPGGKVIGSLVNSLLSFTGMIGFALMGFDSLLKKVGFINVVSQALSIVIKVISTVLSGLLGIIAKVNSEVGKFVNSHMTGLVGILSKIAKTIEFLATHDLATIFAMSYGTKLYAPFVKMNTVITTLRTQFEWLKHVIGDHDFATAAALTYGTILYRPMTLLFNIVDTLGRKFEWFKYIVGDHDFATIAALTYGTKLYKPMTLLYNILTPVSEKFKDFIKSVKRHEVIYNAGKSLNKLKENLKLNPTLEPLIKTLTRIRRLGISGIIQNLKQMKISDVAHGFASAVKIIANALKSLFSAIKGLFDNKISTKLSAAGGALSKFAKDVGRSFSKSFGSSFTQFGKDLVNFIKNLGSAIGGGIGTAFKTLGNLGKAIGQFIKGISANDLKAAAAGLASAFVIFERIKKARDKAKQAKSTVELFKGVLSTLKDTIGSFKKDTISKPKAFQTYASAILLLAGALYVISKVDKSRILQSVGILAGIAVGLFALTIAMDKLIKNSETLTGTSKMIIALSVGILAIAKAFTMFGSVKGESMLPAFAGLVVAFVGFGFLVAEVAVLSKMMASFELTALKAVIPIAFAIYGIAKAFTVFGSIDTDHAAQAFAGLITAMVGFGLLLGEVAALSAIPGVDPATIKALGISMIGVVKAINMLGKLIISWGQVDFKDIWKGALYVAALATAMGLWVRLIGNFGKYAIQGATSLIILSVALITFTGAISMLSNIQIDIGTWIKAIAVLAIMVGAIVLLGQFGQNAISSAASLIILGVALIEVAKALEMLAGIPFLKMIGEMTILMSIMVALGLVATYMSASLAGGAAIFLIASALTMLALAIGLIGSLPLGNIVKGIVSLGAALAVLIVVISSVGVLAGPALILIGAGLALVGLGVAALTWGLKELLPLLGILAVLPQEILDAGLNAFKAIIETLGDSMKNFGTSLLWVAVGFGACAVAVLIGAIALTKFGQALIWVAAGIALVAAAIWALGKVTGMTFSEMWNAAKNMVTGIIDFIVGGIKSLLEKIPLVGKKLAGSLDGWSKDLKDKIGGKEAEDAGKKAPESIAKGVNDNKDKVTDAMKAIAGDEGLGMFKKLAGDQGEGGGLEFINQFTGTMEGGVDIDPASFIGGDFTETLGGYGGEGAEEFIASFQGGVEGAKVDASSLPKSAAASAKNPKAMKSAAKSNVDSYNETISKGKGAESSGKKLGEKSAKGAKNVDGMKTAGGNSADGYIAGVASPDKLAAAYSAGYKLGEKSAQGTKDATKQASPSKVFKQIGRFCSMGFAIGIEHYANLAYDSAYAMGDGVYDATKSALSKVASVAEADFDVKPMITPVVDMSNVTASAKSIGSMMTGPFGLTAPSTGIRLAETIAADIQNGGNPSVASQLGKLTKRLDSVTQAMNSRQMNNYFQIDGSADPEGFADAVAGRLELNARTL